MVRSVGDPLMAQTSRADIPLCEPRRSDYSPLKFFLQPKDNLIHAEFGFLYRAQPALYREPPEARGPVAQASRLPPRPQPGRL